MRKPAKSTVNALNKIRNETDFSWRILAEFLGYDAQPWAARLAAVSKAQPGCISEDFEDVLRTSLGLNPYNRTRTRYGRPCIPWSQWVLIKMEAARRNISPAELITQALGIKGD